MKKCPYCAEEIQDEAILCRFCHSSLNAVEMTKQPLGKTYSQPAMLVSSPLLASYETIARYIRADAWLYVLLQIAMYILPFASIAVMFSGIDIEGIAASLAIQNLLLPAFAIVLSLVLRNVRHKNDTTPAIFKLYLTSVWLKLSLALVAASFSRPPSDGTIAVMTVFLLILIGLGLIAAAKIKVQSRWDKWQSGFRTFISAILSLDLAFSVLYPVLSNQLGWLKLDWGLVYFLSAIEIYLVLTPVLLLVTFTSVAKRTNMNVNALAANTTAPPIQQ